MINKTKKMISIFYKVSIVFVALVALCLYSCKNVQQSVKVDKIDKIYFDKIDENPLFNNKPAEKGFREYVDRSINYPAKAVENKEFPPRKISVVHKTVKNVFIAGKQLM